MKGTIHGRRTTVFAFALLFAMAVMFPLFPVFFDNSDTFWHLKLGQWMLDNGEIVRTAVGAYAAEGAPYVPHEIAFQILVALIHGLFGWKGFFLLRAICVFALFTAMMKMVEQAARERGTDGVHPLSYLLIFLLAIVVNLLAFAVRPQMISVPLIAWFFVLVRSFQYRPEWTKVGLMGLLSLLVANFHGGVWPMIPVLWLLTFLERGVPGAEVIRMRLAATAAIFVFGAINPGGFSSIFYFLLISGNPLTAEISEWAPVPTLNPLFGGFTLLLLWCFFRYAPRTIYHLALAGGILLLGLSALRQFVWIVLFLPYFIPAGPAATMNVRRWSLAAAAAGLAINAAIHCFSSLPDISRTMPVQEMKYIEAQHMENPRVLAPFSASGYVFYKGGRVLADGRFDPFVQDSTRAGSLGFTAAGRSHLIFQGNTDLLIEEVQINPPDFLIYPKSDTPLQKAAIDRIFKEFGRPDYEGNYGYVWSLQ